MDSKTLRECAAAYNAVYNPELRQEVEEQQAFENWVNSLVEEGYDLSEYTWEEMYEEYIEEMGSDGNRPGEAAAQARRQQQKAQAQGAKQALQQGKTLGVAGNFGLQTGTKVKMDSSATRQQGRTVVRATDSPNISNPKNKIQLGGQTMYRAKLGGKDVYVGPKGAAPAPAKPSPAAAKPAPTPAAKPTPAAAKPAATTPAASKPAPTAAAKPAAAKPAPTAPAAKPAPGSTASKPITSQPKEFKSQAAAGEIRGMIGRSMERQAASTPAPKPAAAPVNKARGSSKPGSIVSGFDMFDIVKGYLLDEGYAETEQAAIAIMANMSEEWKIAIISEQQLDEISQKTATRAYAASRTGEFEGADSDRDLRRSDNLEKHIKRKFGDKAVKHAERAADAQTFGRKDASGRRKQSPKPRIERSDYRTTEDGKMNKQDQGELKTELRIKRDRRLRAKED